MAAAAFGAAVTTAVVAGGPGHAATPAAAASTARAHSVAFQPLRVWATRTIWASLELVK